MSASALPGRPMGRLSWGRRYLMCPPQHFGVLYEINPWMHQSVDVEVDAARAQWEGLVATLREAGAEVIVMDPQPEVPDLVFTANAGVVNGNQFVPSQFRHPERQLETRFNSEWFTAHGWQVTWLDPALDHEGAGDALPFSDESGHTVLLSGYRFRSDAPAATALSDMLHVPVRPIELVDPRLYHLDLSFCPLDDSKAMIAPLAWDRYGLKVVKSLVPEPLALTDEEALSFCANSVVVDDNVIMPVVPPRVGRILEGWKLNVIECRVDEFLKAGGGCRCLTLALDTDLSRAS